MFFYFYHCYFKQKLMERQQLQSFTERADQQRGGKSSYSIQKQKFVPPTHPAYIIAPNFQASHIMHLQEELQKHYIAMGLQTGKKKLMKIPQMPSDRFFIIADDSRGPPLLEGQFLTIKSHVVHYPTANSAQQVIAAFDNYIGLGHFEMTEERYQNKDNFNGSAEKAGQNNIQTKTVNSSISQTKSICLKEVSSLKERVNFNQGRLFVYRNRNDNQEYKAIVSQLQSSFQNCSSITFLERIDECNGFTRSNYFNNYCQDYFVLMSHYSLIKLSQCFLNLKGIAVFAEQHQKVDLFSITNIVLLTSRKEMVFRFVEQFANQQVKRLIKTPVEEANNGISQPAVESNVRPKEKKQSANYSQAERSGIKLIKVTDLNKKPQKDTVSISKEAPGKPQLKQNKLYQNSPNVAISKAIQPKMSQIIAQRNNLDYSTTQAHKISKIKRLKSSKSTIQINQEEDKNQYVKQEPNLNIQINQKDPVRPNTSLINSHLRMGSDNYNKRSQQKAQPTHRRMKSDENEGLSPKICLISPRPSNKEEPVDVYFSKQQNQKLFISKEPLVNSNKSKENTEPISHPMLEPTLSLQGRNKLAEYRYVLPGKINKEMKYVQKKVIKSTVVPPALQVMNSISALSQLDKEVNSDFEYGLSKISAIPLKQEVDANNRDKRFTFGLRQQVMKNIGQQQQISQRTKPFKSKSLSQVHRVFNRIKPIPSNEIRNEVVNQNNVNNIDKQSILPKQIIRSVNSPRAGKIYSQLLPKHSKKRVSKLEPDITSENQFLQDLTIKRSLSELPNTPKERFSDNNNRNIQDLIDMSKFQKNVENGMVVYKSKIPVQANEYFPTIVHDKHIQTKNPPITKSKIDKSLENPYNIVSNKEAKKQIGHRNVKYKGDFMQLNVGVLCRPQSLVTTQHKPVFQPLFIANNIVSPAHSKLSSRQKTGPICEMLASKLSNSSSRPQLIKYLQSPEILGNNDSIMSDNIWPLQETENADCAVLYLVEKAQPYKMFQELRGMKSRKDSLISFKDQKQLAQQLPQTINIYDIVYVLPREITANIEKMIKNQPNCYVVHISEGKVKIGPKRVNVRELKQLKGISEQLQQRQALKKGDLIKEKTPSRTIKGKENPKFCDCCSHCSRNA